MSAITQNERLLSYKETMEKTSLCRTTIWQRVKSNQFPSPIKLGGEGSNRVAFLESEVQGWIADRIAERSEGQANA